MIILIMIWVNIPSISSYLEVGLKVKSFIILLEHQKVVVRRTLAATLVDHIRRGHLPVNQVSTVVTLVVWSTNFVVGNT